MRVFFINAVCGSGSTGRIVTDLCGILKQQGHQVRVAYGVGTAERIDKEDTVKISDKFDYYLHNGLSRLSDRAGFYSRLATKKLIAQLEAFRPDIIHIHNIHGYYINIKMLFNYLAKAGIPVVWTLHDCWSMTGHCAHFSYAGCDKWKNGCRSCPQLDTYPISWGRDCSEKNYEEKKKLFTSVKNMQIVTPSEWLAGIVKQSYLGIYPVNVIQNGIDLSVFMPVESNVRERYDIGDKKMVLAVANVWNDKKGLSDICRLSEALDSNIYKVVMVGLTEEQLGQVPDTVLPILRTSSVEELVELYSAADVFVNPSYEETMGMVTAEALACGTPAVVYNKTAVPEAVDASCGIVVEAGNVIEIKNAIEKISNGQSFTESACVNRAKSNDKSSKYGEYINIYQTSINRA